MQDEINKINNSLYVAWLAAKELETYVLETEGESDLYRKLHFYLVPNLSHWINGTQAGSIKDLNYTIETRTQHEKN